MRSDVGTKRIAFTRGRPGDPSRKAQTRPVPRVQPGDTDPMSLAARAASMPLCTRVAGCTRAAGHHELDGNYKGMHPSTFHVVTGTGFVVQEVAAA